MEGRPKGLVMVVLSCRGRLRKRSAIAPRFVPAGEPGTDKCLQTSRQNRQGCWPLDKMSRRDGPCSARSDSEIVSSRSRGNRNLPSVCLLGFRIVAAATKPSRIPARDQAPRNNDARRLAQLRQPTCLLSRVSVPTAGGHVVLERARASASRPS